MPRLRLDWKKTFTELLTIVAGVLIALGAGDWWEGIRERAEATNYAERLIAALKSDEREFQNAAHSAASVDSAALEVLAVYRGREVSSNAAEDFARAVLEASWMPPPALATDTYDDLVSTGRLALLPTGAREALSAYYGRVKVVDEQEAIFRARLASGYWLVPPRVLGADLLPAVWSHARAPAEQPLTVSEAALREMVRRLRELPELETWIADVRHVMTQRAANYSGDLAGRTQTVREVLEALE